MSSGLWKVGNVVDELPLLVHGTAEECPKLESGDADASSANTASGDRGIKESKKSSLKGGVGKKPSALTSCPS